MIMLGGLAGAVIALADRRRRMERAVVTFGSSPVAVPVRRQCSQRQALQDKQQCQEDARDHGNDRGSVVEQTTGAVKPLPARARCRPRGPLAKRRLGPDDERLFAAEAARDDDLVAELAADLELPARKLAVEDDPGLGAAAKRRAGR